MRKILASALVLLVLLVSCASVSTKGRNLNISFRNCGEEVAHADLSGSIRFEMPEDPVREGFSFTGWWIITDEAVAVFSPEWLKENIDTVPDDIVVNARWINDACKVEYAFSSNYVQDGAVFNGRLFKFNSSGKGSVYSLETFLKEAVVALDKVDLIKPHANCVFFGTERAEASDEFPVLYSNVYTSYSGSVDRREGTLCAYRLTGNGSSYSGTLVQVIRIGFKNDKDLWRSHAIGDRSPYGNFILDCDNNRLWAFVTRDYNRTTRFICFEMPKLSDGVYDQTYGVNVVTLEPGDILDMFDVPYSFYLQGACCHEGKIYSTEGMGTDINPCSIRVIDLEKKIEDYAIDLTGRGIASEAELIDFWGGYFWYGDVQSRVFRISGL